jgi:AraC-like DNA-binding protein
MTPDKADITAAADRLREMNAALSDWDKIRQEGERISREEAYQVLTAEIAALRDENERRREEARRLTQQDEDPMAYMAFATDGSESNAVYSTDGEAQAAAEAWGWKVMPLYLAPRLTDAEREAVERACCSLGGVVDMSAECSEWDADARLTLLSLLERLA